MKFIYTTDLHGAKDKFHNILSFALDNKIKLIHLGADMLPGSLSVTTMDLMCYYLGSPEDFEKIQRKFSAIERQKTFVNGFLKKFFRKASLNDITILSFFGNDDRYIVKKNFRKFGQLLDENPFEHENFLFKAYPYVCDYPFRLKTACKLDYKGWKRPNCENGVDISEEGKEDIVDIDAFLNKRTTIEEDFENEVVKHKNLIMSCHMPPYQLKLDVCARHLRNGGYDKLTEVGSKSVYEWIKREQPLLTLHGHIHESYDVTGTWKTYLGKTLVVQPGQSDKKTRFVVIELEPNNVKTTTLMEI